MYRINYSFHQYGGIFYHTIENCKSFAEAEKLFLEKEAIVIAGDGNALWIRAIEKL